MATINDVAREAKVSTATVSRVLKGYPHISDEVRERVLTVISSMEYQPSRVARSLRTSKSSIIGVIVSDIQNTFFTNLARSVEDVSYKNKHAVFLCNSDEDLEKERFYIETMVAENVAGVVICPTYERNNPSRQLVEAGIPIVSVDRRMADLSVDTVVIDNSIGSYNLVDHLISQHGHQRIAIITGPKDTTTARERLEGYRRAIEDAGLEVIPELVKSGSFKVDYGYTAGLELFSLKQPPTAIFAANNALARGVFEAIRHRDLRIPEDVALVAFDHIEWGDLCQPTLTYVDQPSYELGSTSAELLFKRIHNPNTSVTKIMLEPSLHIGQSCGCD